MRIQILTTLLGLLALNGCGTPEAPKSTQLVAPVPDEPKPSLVAAPKPTPQRPWTYNVALAIHGATATGGDRPQLLIDGNSTTYDGGEGYSQTDWTVKPTPSMVVTLKEAETINTVRFLLWDQDNRFYRYKLEISPDADGEKWNMIADHSVTGEFRTWQLISFPTASVRRIRVTGTFDSSNNMFHVVELQAYNIPADVKPTWDEKKNDMPSAASKTGGTTSEW